MGKIESVHILKPVLALPVLEKVTFKKQINVKCKNVG